MPKVGYAKIVFNDEEKLLRFDMNALADLEDHFDKGINEIFSEKRMGFSVIRGLYWAGLKWKMPGLTMERVGNMLTEKMVEEEITLKELMDPVKKAIQAAGWIRSQKKDEADNGDEEKN